MKYVKNFENFKINEEISKKSLFPLITSLFFSLQSFVPSTGYSGISPITKMRKVINNDISNIKIDLQKLEKTISNEELVELISRVKNFRDIDEIPSICHDLEIFAQKNDIYNNVISDSLNNLKSKDIKKLENDYRILFKDYENIKNQIDSDNKLSLIIIIGLILSLIFSFFHFVKNLSHDGNIW